MTAAIWSRLGAIGRRRSFVLRYGVGIASVALALLGTLALDRPGIRGTPFTPAILLSAWYGGFGPGLFAVALSLVAMDYFVVEPRYAFLPITLDDGWYLVVFTASAVLVAWIAGTQRRSEAALRKAHGDLTAREAEASKQASLLDLTHDSIFVRDLDDVVTYWNRGAEQRYGWSAAEAMGRVSHQLTQTVFPAPLAEIESELYRTGQWEGELIHTTRDGTRVVVASRWSLRRDAQGRPSGVLETNNDVTSRKRAEQTTAQVFEASPDAMCIVGRDYRCQRVNPIASRFFAVPADQAIGMHIGELVEAGGFEQRTKPALDRCLSGEEAGYAAWISTRGLGRRYLSVSYSPLRATSDRVEAVLTVARDLTDHMEAWEALREAQAELARVTRVTMLGEITASIAHEVNQPLAAVVMSGNACRRWLAAEPPNLDEARQAAQRVVKDGERAGQVLGRIRTLVQRRKTERNALDVIDVIQEALGFTRAELERQRVAIRTELEDGLPAVLGDRVQLQQVLVNLILNARDAMADVAEAELTVGARREVSGGVLVEVKDRGRGIDAAQADRIFEAFFSTKPTGLGMGLSVSRSIVEMHGGRIWASPNDGPGATMRFTLPAAPAGDGAAAQGH